MSLSSFWHFVVGVFISHCALFAFLANSLTFARARFCAHPSFARRGGAHLLPCASAHALPRARCAHLRIFAFAGTDQDFAFVHVDVSRTLGRDTPSPGVVLLRAFARARAPFGLLLSCARLVGWAGFARSYPHRTFYALSHDPSCVQHRRFLDILWWRRVV